MPIKPHIVHLAETLAERGIRYAFGVTGSGPSVELITALRERGVAFFETAHEASAALMAGGTSGDGTSRGVAISIKGPGVANLLPGIISNYFEGRPALTVSESYPPDLLTHVHKKMPQDALLLPVVKALGYADEAGQVARILLDNACAEIPGPAHLNLCSEPITHEIARPAASVERVQNHIGMEELARAISRAKRPAFILGSLAARTIPPSFWNTVSVPIATTAAGKGALDEYGAYAAGVVTGEVKECAPETAVLSHADIIIGIGLRSTEVVKIWKGTAPFFIIDTVASPFHEAWNAPLVLVSSLDVALASLVAALNGKEWGREHIQQHRTVIHKTLFNEEWMPAHAFEAMNNILGEKSMLVLDTGLFCTIGETVWKAHTPKNFLGSSCGRFMGTGIPTAIGASIAAPNKRVVCAFGDGGVRPYFSEVKLAARAKLPIIFAFFSDGAYGSIAAAARGKGLCADAYELPESSWWRVAQSCGIPSLFVQNLSELKEALVNWGRATGPLFLEMRFDQEKYRAMTARLR